MENKNNNENKKVAKKNNKNKDRGEKLTYSLADQLDELFPQYKPSKKKKEEDD